MHLRPKATVGAQVHLFILVGAFVLLKGAAYWVDRWGIDFSQRGAVTTGASYTDVNAVLPAKTVLAVIAVLCALSLVYFLAAAPMWCMAETRDGTGCRNNSHGILGGCRQVRQHKFQRLRDFFLPARWRKTFSSLVASPATTLGTAGSIASIVPVIAVLVAHR